MHYERVPLAFIAASPTGGWTCLIKNNKKRQQAYCYYTYIYMGGSV